MQPPTIYQAGGTLASESQLYISRQADQQLLESCRLSRFAYILAPRQLGKSSLMVRTATLLAAQGIRSVKIDLAAIGTQGAAETWYYGILYEIKGQLGLNFKLRDWWRAQQELSFIQRFTIFFEEILPKQVTEPLVIFVDEIDTTLSLDYTDDFFALIRSLYVARASQPALARLCFVLIGVATPGDLIRDPRRTPFNIGQRIEMTDFSYEEALLLGQGLGLPASEAKATLSDWTGGHPYLTQCLCQAVSETVNNKQWINKPTKAEINQVVAATFLGDKSEQDNNLQFVRDMLIRRVPDLVQTLTVYREVRRQKPSVADEEQSIIKSHLKLSGIVKREQGLLRVRNQIYYNVFDESWIKSQLPINWAKRLSQARRLIAVSLLVSLALALLTLYALNQQNLATNRTAEAQAARLQAERQQNLAQTQALAFRSQSITDPQLRLLLALEAADRLVQNQLEDPGGQIEDILRQSLQTFTPHQVLRGHTNQVYSAAFSPDSKLVVTAGLDKLAKVWEVATGKELLSLNKHTDLLTGASFSPDGKLVLTTSLDGTAYVWDVATSQLLFKLVGHNGAVTGSFSPYSKEIVTTSKDGTARLWESSTGRLLAVLIGHAGAVSSAVFTPDSKIVITAGEDGTARVWDAQNGKAKLALRGHSGAVLEVVSSPDGGTVVTAGSDGTLRVWDVVSGSPVVVLYGHVGRVAEAGQHQGLSFSPDGKWLLSAGEDGTARLWDWANIMESRVKELKGHTDEVDTAAFSPDGKYLVSASDDKTARLWEVNSTKEVAVLPRQNSPVNSASFSPDGRYVLTAGEDSTVQVWESATGWQQPQQINPQNNPASPIRGLLSVRMEVWLLPVSLARIKYRSGR